MIYIGCVLSGYPLFNLRWSGQRMNHICLVFCFLFFYVGASSSSAVISEQNTVQLPVMPYVQYHAAASLRLSCQHTVAFGRLKWDCKEMTGKRGQRRREKEIREGLACIITPSRWHIYRLCQRGHAFCRSKRSEVWKSQLQHTGWPFNNYYHIPSTHYHDGDCDSTRITTLSCHIAPRRACCVMAVTAQLWRISTIKEDKCNEKRGWDRERYGGRMRGGLEQ